VIHTDRKFGLFSFSKYCRVSTKENRIAELVDYVDVVNNPSWTNDGATIVIGIKNNLTSAVAMHIALKLAQLAVEAGANEFNYFSTVHFFSTKW
jgi:hypothetical protein